MAKLLYYQKNNSVYFAIDDGVNPVDYTVGTYPPNSISIKIDTDGETLTFSHNPPSGQPREIIKRRFDEIADENGTVYSAVDAPAALLAINLAVGQFATTGGSGGGDASASNQQTQITEAQATNSKLDITNARLLSIRTGVDATIFQTNSGQYVVRRETLDGAGNVTVVWCDLSGTIIPTPTPTPIPMSAQEYTLRDVLHKAVNSGSGYNTGDIIIETQVLRLNVSPMQIISSLWYNATTNQFISQPSPATDIEVIAEVGLNKELTQLDIKNNTAPRVLTAGYWELSQLGQSSATISGARYIKIERAEQNGSAGTDQVTVTDVQGVTTDLFQGDVVEFPQTFNYTYGDVTVQVSNSSTIVKITYSE